MIFKWKLLFILATSTCIVQFPCAADDDDFRIIDEILPGMEGIQEGGYQVHVEVTFLTQNRTIYVNEYHDVRNGKSVLKAGGLAVYFFNSTSQSVLINGSTCKVFEGNEAVDHPELDWTWDDNVHAVHGFSAVLWKSFKNKEFNGKQPVRNIICDKYTAKDEDTKSDVEYYFTATNWTPASGLKLPSPIRVRIKNQETTDYEYDLQYDFTFWDPYPPPPETFNIPVGIGCQNLNSPVSMSLPLPDEQYSFTEEYYNEILMQNGTALTVNVFKIWYDGLSQLMRLDGTFLLNNRVTPFREVLDFATGVSYAIYDGGKCLMKAINESFAISNENVRSLKTPKELLRLDGGEYYYIGKGLQRGIECDIWEEVKINYVTEKGIRADKAVFTFYFSSKNTKEVSEGDDISQVPISATVTVYKNGTEKPVAWVVTNFFKFDQTDLRPFHKYMSVEECFTQETARIFFLIDFPGQTDSMLTAKENRRDLELQSVISIAENADARRFRVPYVEVFYQEDRIQILGLLVGRPSYLTGFLPDPRMAKAGYASQQADPIDSEEGCAKKCAGQKCRSFKLCNGKCELSDNRDNFSSANITGCTVYIRSVEPTMFTDSELDVSMKLLEDNVKNGQLKIVIGKDGATSFQASSIKYSVHPFNQDDNEILYEGTFNGYQVREESRYSFPARSQTTNRADCYRACVEETAIACTSFSFCTTTQSCVLSSVYLDSSDDDSMREIVLGTACNVYRRMDLQFFTPHDGEVSQLKGYNTKNDISSEGHCATECKNDKKCRSFEYCAKSKACTFHEIHGLELSQPADQDLQCKHYSMNYTFDYQILGDNMILNDPNNQSLTGLSVGECAKYCSQKINQFECKSFNYCPTPDGEIQKSKCVLSKLNTTFGNHKTETVPGCYHYFRGSKQNAGPSDSPPIDPSVSDKIYFPLKDIIRESFSVHAETTVVLAKTKITSFTDEYHNLTAKSGILTMTEEPEASTYFYNTVSGEIVQFSGQKCRFVVNSKDDIIHQSIFWGWIGKNGVIGPSAIFFRDVIQPKWIEQQEIRGVRCEMFEALDEEDKNVKLRFCFTAENWANPAKGLEMRVPIYAEASGPNVEMSIHITYFHAEGKYSEYFKRVPRGIGCEGAKKTKQLPSISDQFSFDGEQFAIALIKEKPSFNVENIKIWYDGVGKVLKVTSINKNGPFTEVQDYNTGVSYHFDKYDKCTIGPIRNTFFGRNTDKSLVKSMENPKKFLNMDGEYYYSGMTVHRGVPCEVWETVKKDDPNYFKVVNTFYISTGKVATISEGDEIIGVPITLQIFLYVLEDVNPVLWNFNFFSFDESEHKDFSELMNVETCFEEEGSHDYFALTFQTTAEKIDLVKKNTVEFKKNAMKAIEKTAVISSLRLPLLKIDFDSQNILVQGKLVEKAPAKAGFIQLNSTSGKLVPNKGVKTTADVGSSTECASQCLTDKSIKCTAFTICQKKEKDKFECYLTDKKESETMGGPLPTTSCTLYLKSVSTETTPESSLKEAIQKLDTDVKAGKLVIEIVPQKSVTASGFSSSLTPSAIGFSENLEMVQTNKQIVSGSESQTSFDVMMKVTSARACYQECLNEPSLTCAAFSFCPNTQACRLSSIYISELNTDDVEDATGCKVYRKNALRFFTEYKGTTSGTPGEATVKNVENAAACAQACRSSTFFCRSFDYCRSTKECVLSKFHALDSPPQVTNNRRCSHFSLQFSSEFVEYGRDIVVDKDSASFSAVSMEECSKRCYEWEAFNCTSINFCPQEDDRIAVCDINAKSSSDKNVVTKESDYCKHYLRKPPVDVFRKEKEIKTGDSGEKKFLGVTKGAYNAVLATMFFVGIFLGVTAFFIYSYYRLRSSRRDDITVRFTKE